MDSIKFGNKDAYTDFRCFLKSINLSAPTVQTKFVEVPLRNGAIDLTETIANSVRYNDRDIEIELFYSGNQLLQTYSNILNYLHGKRMRIVLDRDSAYFYTGRLNVVGYDVRKYGGIIKIKGTCEPFKWTVLDSTQDWLWDPFNFETGYINELSQVTVDGETTVTLATDSYGYATITTNAPMRVVYNGISVNIPIGTTTMYDFEFTEGTNYITFYGNGEVSIAYRGGRL